MLLPPTRPSREKSGRNNENIPSSTGCVRMRFQEFTDTSTLGVPGKGRIRETAKLGNRPLKTQ